MAGVYSSARRRYDERPSSRSRARAPGHGRRAMWAWPQHL